MLHNPIRASARLSIRRVIAIAVAADTMRRKRG